MHRLETTYRRHLAQEQRRAVLDALARRLDPGATVGEVLDAAQALGWGEHMGELSLQDLADALLADEGEDDDEIVANAGHGHQEDEEEAEDEEAAEDEDLAAAGSRSKARRKVEAKAKAKTKPKPKAKAKAKTKPKAKAKKTTAKSTTRRTSPSGTKKSAKRSAKKSGKASAARIRALKKKVDADERMSLEEAAELFVPMVSELGEATMQQLEELTGVGRRKLRFHIGQLVKHDHLERHGMGRGTHYTVA